MLHEILFSAERETRIYLTLIIKKQIVICDSLYNYIFINAKILKKERILTNFIKKMHKFGDLKPFL